VTWFKRQQGVAGGEKRAVPDGVWVKCDSCGEILYRKELARQGNVCPKCRHHFRITSKAYLDLLLDEGTILEYDGNLVPTDPLEFKDTAKYSDRIVKSLSQTGLPDAIRSASGTISGHKAQVAAMDFGFMGGSVGAVVGEKLVRAIHRAIEDHAALVTVSCSGGMRMQEGVFSLMQMAKVSAALVRLSRARQPFISIITNPTTGGTTASFAMLGDVNISEPGALICFAGPRVIKQTIGQDLPDGFQLAEFLLEKGFLDLIVERPQLKQTVANLIGLLKGAPNSN
jgi:acetyl-CoA carboxylase carboxyl transferase subunit beta